MSRGVSAEKGVLEAAKEHSTTRVPTLHSPARAPLPQPRPPTQPHPHNRHSKFSSNPLDGERPSQGRRRSAGVAPAALGPVLTAPMQQILVGAIASL